MQYLPEVRVGKVDITPRQLPVAMAGFGSGSKAGAIADTLECNMVWLGHGDQACILATFDSLFVGIEIRKAIAEASGLPLDAILLAASHTHYAPALERTKPLLGAADESHFGYVIDLVRQLVISLKQATAVPFEQAFAAHQSNAGVSRRLKWPWPHIGGRSQLFIMPGIENAPNPAISIPNMVRVAVLRSMPEYGSAPQAVFWSLACHPTRYPFNTNVTAEFVGAVRQHIRAKYGPAFPVLYFQGFSGDIIPRPQRKHRRFSAASLLFGPRAQPFSETEWSGWVGGISAEVTAAIDDMELFVRPDTIKLHSAKLPLGLLIDGAQNRPVEGSRLCIGSLDLLLIGAEVVSGYEEKLPESAWPIGCAHDVFGYWPTNGQVQEGGYESSGFLPRFGLKGGFRHDPESVFQSLLSSLSV